MARVFHRGTGQGALDYGLTPNEDALRRKAYAVSHGEPGPHAAEPNHPTRAEQHYLDAIRLFRSRRMSAGFDAIEKGDFQVLLRVGREKQKRQRRGLEDRPHNDGRPWWFDKSARDTSAQTPEILSVSRRPEGTNYVVKVFTTKYKQGYDLVDVLVHTNGAVSTKSAHRSTSTPLKASAFIRRYRAADRVEQESMRGRDRGRRRSPARQRRRRL